MKNSTTKKSKNFYNSNNDVFFEDQLLLSNFYKETIFNYFNEEIILGNFNYLEIFQVFCKQKTCNFFENENYSFIDHTHLSYYGAKRIYNQTELEIILMNSKYKRTAQLLVIRTFKQQKFYKFFL